MPPRVMNYTAGELLTDLHNIAAKIWRVIMDSGPPAVNSCFCHAFTEGRTGLVPVPRLNQWLNPTLARSSAAITEGTGR
jgi:hypothetical protein